MKNRTLLLMITMCLTFVLPSLAIAIPANPSLTQLQQPDGSLFDVQIAGDEWNNRIETKRGHTIEKAQDGSWRHITGYAGNTAEMSGALANHAPPSGLKKHIKKKARPAFNRPGSQSSGAQSGLQSAPGDIPQGIAFGNFNGPVLFILAEYSDRLGTFDETSWGNFITNNITDYFAEASYGKVNLTPAAETSGNNNNGVIGWVNLGPTHPNTGSNTDTRNQQITRDAIIAADPFIDYASYDTNSDGLIDADELAVVVVVAGFERAYSFNFTPSVWGHKWSIGFSVGAPSVDGVVVGNYNGGKGGYAQFGEIHQSNSSNLHQATMGIMVHELGHLIFGLPDLYDIDSSSSGIGAWGVMASGSWGAANSDTYAGETPVLPSAWVKLYLQWVDDIEGLGVVPLTAAGDPSATSANTVRKSSTPTASQYFLTENRKPVGYDLGLQRYLGTNFNGLAIWHIDESRSNNSNDAIRLVDLEEANGFQMGTSYGTPSNLWFQGNATNFDDTTNPNSKLNNGTASGVGIDSISVAGTVMTVDFGGVAPGVLAVSPVTNLTSSGNIGGPFTPSSQGYTLSNTGGVAIDYSVTNTESWVDLSSISGTLNPGSNTLVTVSINGTANSLAASAFNDTVTFTNTTNGSGNTTRQVNLTVVDNEDPVITAPADITVNNDAGLASAIVTFLDATATDNSGSVTVIQTAGLASGSAFPIGNTTVTWTATDPSGNFADASMVVTVVDNEDPVITAPANITVNTDAGILTAVVTFASATATDNSGSVTVIQTAGPASGSAFPIGNTTITWTATDSAGNSASASTIVTVIATPSATRNDFDGDGDSDLLLVHDTGFLFSILLENSVFQDFGFLLQADPTQGWTVHATADFNGDGKKDILLYNNTTGEYRVVLMDGTTVISDTVVLTLDPVFGLEPRGVGDFNGDGFAEVVVYQPASGFTALIYLNGGGFASFEIVTQIDEANNVTLKDTGDFNQDGKTDLVTFNTVTGETEVIEMNGSTPLATTSIFTLAPATGLTVEDNGEFDGNGKTDIAVLHTSGSLGVFTLNGVAYQSFYAPGNLPTDFELVNAGRYDGDNKTDFLIYNATTGELQTAIQDGATITNFNSVINLGPAGWSYHKGKP